MAVRGVRGATTAGSNSEDEILSATQSLLEEMVAANGIRADDIAAAFFTVTEDLDAAFPAKAARLLGWQHVPLLDGREIPVPHSLLGCVRVLLLWNTDLSQQKIIHIYQGGAKSLRSDLAGPTPTSNREEMR